MGKKKSSAVWTYFVAMEEKAKCLLCEKLVSRSGMTTTNLRKHIQTKHPSEYVALAATEAENRYRKESASGSEVLSIKRVVRIVNPRDASFSYVRTAEKDSNEEEYLTKKFRSKHGAYEALGANVLRDFNNDDDSSQSNNGNSSKNENSVFVPSSSIKRENEDEEYAEAAQQSEEVEDLWHYFDKVPPNRAQCILCKETFSRHSLALTQHINEKHRKVALDLPSDSDDDQRDLYTEVVYLEDEQPIDSRKIKVKSTKNHQEVRPKKRRLSTNIYEVVQKVDSEAKKEEKSDEDEEIENFGRYVIGLLKKLPKNVCTQLQLDIINMVMTAKLKESMSNESVNVRSIQDGVVFTPVSVSSANVIVSTASNVIRAGQNDGSQPSLEIIVENEKES